MKSKNVIERGARYVYVKVGDVVTAIAQVAVVKGLAMWEIERSIGNGEARRLIVPAKALRPLSQ